MSRLQMLWAFALYLVCWSNIKFLNVFIAPVSFTRARWTREPPGIPLSRLSPPLADRTTLHGGLVFQSTVK